MPVRSLSRHLSLQRLKRESLGLVIDNASAPHGQLCLRKVDRIRPTQRRTLVTAVTTLPAIDIPETSKESIRILPNLIGSALAWASQPHSRKDPATHAIVLIRKQVIPKGKDTLLKILRETQQLSSLDVLVAVVDSIGSSPVGVSVLLASKSEKVSIKSLKGAKNDVLRVGKWHAKDTEEDESMNFEDILASIRKGKEVPSAAESTSESIGRDLVFVLGEMEGVQNQASSINKEYPLADILGITLSKTPTINSLFTTLVHNGNVIPSMDVVLFHIPRSKIEEYHSPIPEHKVSWVTEKHIPTITSFSGNLILELDNKPAMPYLLSLLPPQSNKEKLNPRPLVAKLHASSQPLGSIYVNVLGGSKSRGGIALDPLVTSGRLSNGTKIEFAQHRRGTLPAPDLPSSGVHIQLEVTSSAQTNPGWTKDGKPTAERVTFDPRGRQDNETLEETYEDSPWKRRTGFRSIRMGLFSAGSEEGFLVGQRGVVPWLCRTPASRVRLEITKAQRHLPVHPTVNRLQQEELDILRKEEQYAKYLKENNLIVEKKVVYRRDGTFTTRSREVMTESPTSQQQTHEPEKAPKPAKTSKDKLRHKRLSQARRNQPRSRLSYLPPKVQRLLDHYPATKRLVLQRKIRSIPYYGRWVKHGPRKYSFRARASWFDWRHGFQRSDHRPAGNRLYTRGKAETRSAYRKGQGAREIATHGGSQKKEKEWWRRK